jgi:GrpB-like predicted nucleotidyltransferase (UPF0157 family)
MINDKFIGLPKGTVALYSDNIVWKRKYEEEKEILQAALGNNILDIQHIGSTSIPGMIAKPIIDIAIAVKKFEDAFVYIQPIENLGYEYKGELGIPRRHYFVKGDPRTHHIHMVEIESREWINQILFRDYLIQHPQSSKAYADLKMELAKKFPTDREAYTDAKAPFINQILKLASSEKGENAKP